MSLANDKLRQRYAIHYWKDNRPYTLGGLSRKYALSKLETMNMAGLSPYMIVDRNCGASVEDESSSSQSSDILPPYSLKDAECTQRFLDRARSQLLKGVS